jgi:HEAT repeat protein
METHHRVLAILALAALAGCGGSRGARDGNELGRLTGLLKAESPSVRISALRDLALKRAEAVPAAPAVLPLLHDPDPKVRWTAAETLSAIGPAAAELTVAPLAVATKDPDGAVRLRAVQALRRMGPRAVEAVTELTASMADSQWFVRAAAAETAGALGPPARQAVPALIPLLSDVDPQVRPRAAWALGRMGQDAAPAAGDLAAVLAKGDPALRELAAMALRGIGPAAFRPAARLMADERADVRLAVLKALEAAGDLAAAKAGDFQPRLAAGDATVRRDAAREIADMLEWAEPVVGSVLAAVSDPRPSVAERAIELAGRIGPALATIGRAASAAPVGEGELASHGARTTAATAKLVASLAAKMTDPEPAPRRAAATALGQMGPAAASAQAALSAAAANDQDRPVRDAAAWALTRIRH